MYTKHQWSTESFLRSGLMSETSATKRMFNEDLLQLCLVLQITNRPEMGIKTLRATLTKNVIEI